MLASWVTLGIGPWFVMRNVAIRALYRDEPCEITLTLALANSGDLQVELIQQHDDTPSIYTEFLSSGRRGLSPVGLLERQFRRDDGVGG